MESLDHGESQSGDVARDIVLFLLIVVSCLGEVKVVGIARSLKALRRRTLSLIAGLRVRCERAEQIN